MINLKLFVYLLSWGLWVTTTHGFQPSMSTTFPHGFRLYAQEIPVEEARAMAMSNYLAKAHEEKLRAIKDMEEKKNAEMETLKKQLVDLKNGSGAMVMAPTDRSSMSLTSLPPSSSSPAAPIVTGIVSSTDLLALSKEELSTKLLQYQSFMAKYIVDAHEQKAKAIEEVNKKWQDKLLLGSSSSSTSPNNNNNGAVVVKSEATKLFDVRNAAVAAAAAAGKSRWGSMEVQRASTASTTTTANYAPVNGAYSSSTTTTLSSVAAVPAMSPPSSSVMPISIPKEVEAADHGLRADGGVGGPSLAERVTMGAKLGVNTMSTVVVPSVIAAPSLNTILYQKRNQMILQAARMGKSRWGKQEIDQVQTYIQTIKTGGTQFIIPSTDPIQSELGQRFNVGARLLGY